jgi:tetratricopeptide (TPR) repeat protein
MNGSTASIASTVSVLEHGRLPLRRSLSNLSGYTFSALKRRNSHHSDRGPISLASLDDLSLSLQSRKERFDEKRGIAELEAHGMKERVILGCHSCRIQVANTVGEHFEKLRSHCIKSDYERAEKAAEELSQIILPLCRSCRLISSKYIFSVFYYVAGYYRQEERYYESISIYERILNTCIEEDLFDCSYIMFNCIDRMVRIYAYQGLLHEVEQKLLQAGPDRESAKRLALFYNRLLLAKVFSYQQRPHDALREYGSLATLCMEYYGLHSGFMHWIVAHCAEACTELHDYQTSIDLYRRLLAEEDPTSHALEGRISHSLVGLSNTYRSGGSFQNCKVYANKAMEILTAHESALVRLELFDNLVQCHFNLGVSFDNEGNAAEAESYFSRVISGCETLNKEKISSEAVSIILALQHHYYDRPRLIDVFNPKISNYLAHLADAASGRPATLQRLLVTIMKEAEILSKSHQPQRAEYLFNQAKGLLDPGNLHLECFFAVQIAQHHRRNGEWKDVMRYLEKAAMLSEQMYGPNHACAVSFKEQLAAFGEEVEKEGLSVNAMAQSLSLITISSSNTRSTGSSESDELDFLEDGMFWGQPPASLLNFA